MYVYIYHKYNDAITWNVCVYWFVAGPPRAYEPPLYKIQITAPPPPLEDNGRN